MISHPGLGPSYVANAPLVIAQRLDGGLVYLYQGTLLPASIPEKEVRRLLKAGHLKAIGS